MNSLFLRVKGIVKKGDRYLVIKRWVDDRIPDPFVWEFFDGEVAYGEAPDMAVLRVIRDTIGVEGAIDRIVYTWSSMLGDTQCVGLAYLCHIDADESAFILPEEFGGWEWIERERFDRYIENQFVLHDLEGVVL